MNAPNLKNILLKSSGRAVYCGKDKITSSTYCGIAWISLLSLSGCFKTEVPFREKAEKFFSEFHVRFSKADYSGIYKEASKELRVGISMENFSKALKVAHENLGEPVRYSFNNYLKTKGQNGENLILFVLDTEFTNGKGMESFYFLAKGDEILLFRYDINSDDLMKRIIDKSLDK